MIVGAGPAGLGAAVYAASERLSVRLSSGVDVAARSVLLACGVSYRRLGVTALEALVGAGVFYGAAVGEAPALMGLDAFVVGAGNSAGQAALHLARYATRVTMVVRAPDLDRSMSAYLVREVAAHDRIEVLVRSEVVGGRGDGHLEQLTLRDNVTGELRDVPAAGLFILIGAEPGGDGTHDPQRVDRPRRSRSYVTRR